MPRPILMLLALLFVTACATKPPDGICAGLAPLADQHAAALLADGGDQSVVTGNRLIAGIDAACR